MTKQKNKTSFAEKLFMTVTFFNVLNRKNI